MFVLAESVAKKWAPVIDNPDLPPITDPYKKMVVTQLLENTARAEYNDMLEFKAQNPWMALNEAAPINAMGASSSTHGTGNVDTFDPILISMIRRSMPNLNAFDYVGVQPMTGPSSTIFALRARETSQTGTEIFYNESSTSLTGIGGTNATANSLNGYANSTQVGGAASLVGTVPGVSNNAGNNTYNFSGAFSRTLAEGLGVNSTAIWGQVAISVEKVNVEAKSRAIKTDYSQELAQDLRAIHNIDAATLLSDTMQAQIVADINREMMRTVNITAVPGSQTGTASAGTFDLDVDSNGRWHNEKYKGLMVQIDMEANKIAKDTRLGRGNVIITSSNVASALRSVGLLSNTPNLNGNNGLNVDDTGNTFAGVLNGSFKLFIDPYTTADYFTVGYRGTNPIEAGLFYCPYVPAQKAMAVNPDTLQPIMGYKTRYGVVANPFAEGTTQGLGRLLQDSNVWYRRSRCSNIL